VQAQPRIELAHVRAHSRQFLREAAQLLGELLLLEVVRDALVGVQPRAELEVLRLHPEHLETAEGLLDFRGRYLGSEGEGAERHVARAIDRLGLALRVGIDALERLGGRRLLLRRGEGTRQE
jgi:hypothetical protein